MVGIQTVPSTYHADMSLVLESAPMIELKRRWVMTSSSEPLGTLGPGASAGVDVGVLVTVELGVPDDARTEDVGVGDLMPVELGVPDDARTENVGVGDLMPVELGEPNEARTEDVGVGDLTPVELAKLVEARKLVVPNEVPDLIEDGGSSAGTSPADETAYTDVCGLVGLMISKYARLYAALEAGRCPTGRRKCRWFSASFAVTVRGRKETWKQKTKRADSEAFMLVKVKWHCDEKRKKK